MGAGAGQTGGGMQTMPQMGQMPSGAPTQSGLGALATQMQQNGQADPRFMAIMQAFQNQGGMPGAGMMPPGGMPTQQDMMDQMRQANPGVGQPQVSMSPMPGMAGPGGAPVQRPLPVGAGGKGIGMPGSGVPGTMVNPPRPMMPKPQTMAPNRRPGFSGFR